MDYKDDPFRQVDICADSLFANIFAFGKTKRMMDMIDAMNKLTMDIRAFLTCCVEVSIST